MTDMMTTAEVAIGTLPYTGVAELLLATMPSAHVTRILPAPVAPSGRQIPTIPVLPVYVLLFVEAEHALSPSP